MPHLSSVLYQAKLNDGSVKRIAARLGLPLEFVAVQVEAARERTANVVTMEAVNEGTEPRPGRSVQLVTTNTMIMATLPDGETIEVPSGSRISFADDMRDWRRVVVTWKGNRVQISRAAWEACKTPF